MLQLTSNPGLTLTGFRTTRPWFSLATQAQEQSPAQSLAQAPQTQATGMTQVKKKFDPNTSTSKIIQTLQTI